MLPHVRTRRVVQKFDKLLGIARVNTFQEV